MMTLTFGELINLGKKRVGHQVSSVQKIQKYMLFIILFGQYIRYYLTSIISLKSATNDNRGFEHCSHTGLYVTYQTNKL
jgi:hypothetical protein